MCLAHSLQGPVLLLGPLLGVSYYQAGDGTGTFSALLPQFDSFVDKLFDSFVDKLFDSFVDSVSTVLVHCV